MTGYSFLEKSNDGVTIAVELRSLNNRFLEIYTRIPKLLYNYEVKIRDVIKSKINRGKVEVNIYLTQTSPDVKVTPMVELARTYLKALQTLNRELQLNDNIHLNHLLKQEGILVSEDQTDESSIWEFSRKILSESLEILMDVKQLEGDATEKNIISVLDEIDRLTAIIEKHAPEQVVEFEQKIMKKMKELLGTEFDEQRILTEVGLLASRVDINEEIQRLNNHAHSFRKLCNRNDAIGKQLDFITQEMLREANTIGSKTNLLTISNAVIQLKTEIEKLKEQVRNIE